MSDLAVVAHINATDTRKPLTERQAEILAFIRESLDTWGWPPTRAEIASRFRFKSANAAEDHLRALEKKGYVGLMSGIARGLSVLDA